MGSEPYKNLISVHQLHQNHALKRPPNLLSESLNYCKL